MTWARKLVKALMRPSICFHLQATLWDAACRPIFDFGSGPYNIARWNPFGNFLMLAGFGNLPGEGRT